MHDSLKKREKAGNTRGKEMRAIDKQESPRPYEISSQIWDLEGEYRHGLWKAQRSREHGGLFLVAKVALRVVQKFS